MLLVTMSPPAQVFFEPSADAFGDHVAACPGVLRAQGGFAVRLVPQLPPRSLCET